MTASRSLGRAAGSDSAAIGLSEAHGQRDTKKRVSHRKISCAVVSSGATDKGTFFAVVFHLHLAIWLAKTLGKR